MGKATERQQYPVKLIDRATKMHQAGVSLTALAEAFRLRPNQVKELLGLPKGEKSPPATRRKVQGLASPDIADWLNGLPFSSSAYVSAAVSEFHSKYQNKPAEEVPNA